MEVRSGAGSEILIKSPGQMKGYYKRPDLDAESFTEDGFFKTGDMGERRPDGLLKVTGRVKELFKTAKGKYVAPAPIENRINEHPLVELSMVSGVGQPAAYGIVVLAEHIRPTLSDPTVRAEIQAEMTALLKRVNDGVADYERLQMLVIAKEPWRKTRCFGPELRARARPTQVRLRRQRQWRAWPSPICVPRRANCSSALIRPARQPPPGAWQALIRSLPTRCMQMQPRSPAGPNALPW